MKTLYESLLDDIDTTMSNSKSAVNAELNIDTLPTTKDFEKGIMNNKWHQALWYCPNVINRYRSKYSDIIPKEVDSIMVVLDATYSRVVDCNLYFTTRAQFFGVNRLKTIVGWNEGFVGANLRKYKQMAIDLITKLANNPDKMDKMLQYSAEYTKYWNDVDNDRIKNTFKYQIKSFNEL